MADLCIVSGETSQIFRFYLLLMCSSNAKHLWAWTTVAVDALLLVRDIKYNTMKLKNVFSIMTMLMVVLVLGCKQDEDPGVRPTITITDPANNATGIAINSKVSANF